MYKSIALIILYFLIVSCKASDSSTSNNIAKDMKKVEINNDTKLKTILEKKTMNISLTIPYGENSKNNNLLSEHAHIKIKGSFGDINAKVDSVSGASGPSGVVKKINDYRYLNIEKYGEKASIPEGFRGILMFGATPSSIYLSDGLSGNEYGQKIINNNTGAKIKGTGIKKIGGTIIIRYIHAGGILLTPRAYEIKSDSNGIIKIGKYSKAFKKSVTVLEKDTSFDNIEFIDDVAENTITYWEGDIRADFDNNTLTLKGTLTLIEEPKQ